MKIKVRPIVVALISIFLGLVAGAIIMAFSGFNPFEGFMYLFLGGVKSVKRIGSTLSMATPLIFTGLSVAFAFRTGLFNIGASGQMFFGGLCATVVALTLNIPRGLLLPIIILAGAAGGALWAFIPGLLKSKFNVHEVVSTIMMNWISYWTVVFVVQNYILGHYATESLPISAEASLRMGWLTKLFNGANINLGLLLAIGAVAEVWVVLNKTVFGFKLKAVGFNSDSAKYAGMNVNKNVVQSMMIAGALAGLAGVTQYLGFTNTMQIDNLLPSQGFDGIAVSLLGANSPVGVLLASIFFGLLHAGKGFMGANTGIPKEIGDTIIATIIYFAAINLLIHKFIDWFQKKKSGGNK